MMGLVWGVEGFMVEMFAQSWYLELRRELLVGLKCVGHGVCKSLVVVTTLNALELDDLGVASR